MRLVFGALGAFGAAATVVAGTAVGYGTMLGSTPAPCSCGSPERRESSASATAPKSPLVREATRREAYDRLAESFDEEIEWHELMSGIKLMRWWMLRQLKGDVLEVAAGTGRNLAYYPPGVRLTATDCSAPMVAVCRAKAERAEYVAPAATSSERKKKHRTTNGETRETYVSRKVANGGPGVAGGPSVIRRRVLVDARVCDAAIAPFESESFDAVVDTFGLCSFEDPVAALREMSRVCRGKKKKKKNAGAGSGDAPGSGKIYLLEHGRSDWDWVSNILDKHADPHAKRWGCYWNRDILAIVREAGLEIESVARYHLGTTYVIVAAPPSEA